MKRSLHARCSSSQGTATHYNSVTRHTAFLTSYGTPSPLVIYGYVAKHTTISLTRDLFISSSGCGCSRSELLFVTYDLYIV